MFYQCNARNKQSAHRIDARHFLSTQHSNTPYRPTLSIHTLSTHPLTPPFHPTLSTHPINTSYQRTLSTHPINAPSQHTLSTHPLTPPFQPTLSTHPINPYPINTHIINPLTHHQQSLSTQKHPSCSQPPTNYTHLCRFIPQIKAVPPACKHVLSGALNILTAHQRWESPDLNPNPKSHLTLILILLKVNPNPHLTLPSLPLTLISANPYQSTILTAHHTHRKPNNRIPFAESIEMNVKSQHGCMDGGQLRTMGLVVVEGEMGSGKEEAMVWLKRSCANRALRMVSVKLTPGDRVVEYRYQSIIYTL